MGGLSSGSALPRLFAPTPRMPLCRELAGAGDRSRKKPPQGGAGEAQRSELRRGCRAKVQGTDLKTRVPSGSLDGDP